MRKTMLLFSVLLLAAGVVRADSLSANQVSQQLDSGAVIPWASGVGRELADNLLPPKAAASYAALEPDSLQLSIDSVLKARSLAQARHMTQRLAQQADYPPVP